MFKKNITNRTTEATTNPQEQQKNNERRKKNERTKDKGKKIPLLTGHWAL